MRPKSPLARLTDMQAAIKGIADHLKTEPLATFHTNMLVFRAIERELEIISEASRHLPSSLTEKHPTIPWRQIADLGNVLRHAYQKVEPNLLRLVIQDHLPDLSAAVNAMIEESD